MNNKSAKTYFFTAALLALMAFRPCMARAAVTISYQYTLSNFSGTIPYNWPTIRVDEQRNEIYVVDARKFDVTIFNDKGMQLYRFGEDNSLGAIIDVGVASSGNILVLSKGIESCSIFECDFRGEMLSKISLQNLPPDLQGFNPDRMICRDKCIFFLDIGAMIIVVTSEEGLFQRRYDLAPLLEVEGEEEKAAVEINGFSVDPEGNMLFTVPVFFAAYRLSPDGTLEGFGKSGSGPGGFGVVGGIVADKRGNLYVADRLKSVILIFDKSFHFLKEFGYRGTKPENLIGPRQLALDEDGRLYVGQLQGKGVSVFKISYD